MRLLRLGAPALLAAALLTVAAPPASAASEAPPPQWLRDTFQVEPPASLLRTPAQLAGACPTVVAYVSRGSDENPGTASQDYTGRSKYYAGVGEEMSALVNYLATLYPSFKVVPNAQPGYPATGFLVDDALNGTLPTVFMNSVYAGAQQAIDDLNAIRANCPASRLVIAGYSQGAMVNRLAMASQGSGPAVNGKKISFLPSTGQVAALHFGDPTWGRNPASYGPRYQGDTFRPGALPAGDELGVARWFAEEDAVTVPHEELLQPAHTDAAWNEVSYCHGGDPACQFEHQKGAGLREHLTYDEQDFFAAGNQAAAVFNTSGNLRVSNAKAVPSTQLTATPVVCLPRGAASSRTATSAASATGAPSRTFTSTWVATNAGPGGTVHTPLTLATGATGTLTVTSSSDWAHNDTWQVTTATGITGVPDRLVNYQRVCPLLGVAPDPA